MAADGAAAQCSSFSLAQALEVALGLKPHVINLSLAGPSDPLLARLLDRALADGIVVVAAEPHRESPAARFPASHPRVIVAHSSFDALGAASPYRIAAPGNEVLTTTPGASYAFLSGNSLAAAHTTGVIALLMERDPELDVERIAALLTETTTLRTGSFSINACLALDRLTGNRTCEREAELARF
jgi:subtilisin family serine protease